jgi:DNA-binding transcriptional ArsR family regulator
MIDPTIAARIAVVLHALGESTRLRLIRVLTAGEHSVNALAAAVDCPVVNVSHHLGVLRNAGVLTVEKRGRQRVYALSADLFHDGLDGVLGEFRFDGCRVMLNGVPGGGKKRKG